MKEKNISRLRNIENVFKTFTMMLIFTLTFLFNVNIVKAATPVVSYNLRNEARLNTTKAFQIDFQCDVKDNTYVTTDVSIDKTSMYKYEVTKTFYNGKYIAATYLTCNKGYGKNLEEVTITCKLTYKDSAGTLKYESTSYKVKPTYIAETPSIVLAYEKERTVNRLVPLKLVYNINLKEGNVLTKFDTKIDLIDKYSVSDSKQEIKDGEGKITLFIKSRDTSLELDKFNITLTLNYKNMYGDNAYEELVSEINPVWTPVGIPDDQLRNNEKELAAIWENNKTMADSHTPNIISITNDEDFEISTTTKKSIYVEVDMNGSTFTSATCVGTKQIEGMTNATITSGVGEGGHKLIKIDINLIENRRKIPKMTFDITINYKNPSGQSKSIKKSYEIAEAKLSLDGEIELEKEEGHDAATFGDPRTLVDVLDVKTGLGEVVYAYGKVVCVILTFCAILMSGITIMLSRKAEERSSALQAFLYITIGVIIFDVVFIIYSLLVSSIESPEEDIRNAFAKNDTYITSDIEL